MKKGKLYIYDEIAPWGVSAGEFTEKLNALKDQGITSFTLFIDSPGGDVFDAIAIYNELKALEDLTVIITGLAASAAGFIAMAGRDVKIVSNSFVMIHNPWTWASGDANYLKKVQENLEMIQDVITAAYVERTGQDEDTVRRWMDEDTWFNADEAVERGFADTVIAPGTQNKFKGFFNFFKPNKSQGVTSMETFKKQLIALLGLALAVTDKDTDFLAAIGEKVNALKDQVAALTGERDDLKNQVSSLTVERDDLKTRCETAEAKAAELLGQKINAELDAAIGRGIITDAERSVWEDQLRKDFDAAKTILDGKNTPLQEPVEPPKPSVNSRGETAEVADLIRNQMQGKGN